jgi:hypothetical protein
VIFDIQQVFLSQNKEVGYGYKYGYVVANCYPAGNLMCTFKNNVKKP